MCNMSTSKRKDNKCQNDTRTETAAVINEKDTCHPATVSKTWITGQDGSMLVCI